MSEDRYDCPRCHFSWTENETQESIAERLGERFFRAHCHRNECSGGYDCPCRCLACSPLLHEATGQIFTASDEPLLRWFEVDRVASATEDDLFFAEFARWIVKNVSQSAERTLALRKLLEAKDQLGRANAVGLVDVRKWAPRRA